MIIEVDLQLNCKHVTYKYMNFKDLSNTNTLSVFGMLLNGPIRQKLRREANQCILEITFLYVISNTVALFIVSTNIYGVPTMCQGLYKELGLYL